MSTEMGTADWILQLLLGGILGMLGQGIRVVAGLKKVNDQATQEGRAFGDLFQSSSLGLSLLIGFLAGALAIIGLTGGSAAMKPSRELIITLLGAGYAGTDFIEGFIKKYLPAGRGGPPPAAKTDTGEQPAVG